MDPRQELSTERPKKSVVLSLLSSEATPLVICKYLNHLPQPPLDVRIHPSQITHPCVILVYRKIALVWILLPSFLNRMLGASQMELPLEPKLG